MVGLLGPPTGRIAPPPAIPGLACRWPCPWAALRQAGESRSRGRQFVV